MRTISSKLAVSLIAVTSAAAPAIASDAKNYPGVMCLASGSDITRMERSASGRANNLGPNSINFICPAVKDFASIKSAVVNVFDGEPGSTVGSTVSCTVRVRDGFAGAIASDTDDTSDLPGGVGSAHLTFSFSDGPGGDDPLSFYVIACSVPAPSGAARSGIFMYQITEND
jgi:hypothetical protein